MGGRGAASAAHTLCRQQLLPPPRSATRPVQHTFPGPRREAGHLAQPEDARGGRRRPSPSGGLSRRFPAQVEDAAGGESVTGTCFLHRPGRREPAWSCLAAPPAVWESWLLWLGKCQVAASYNLSGSLSLCLFLCLFLRCHLQMQVGLPFILFLNFRDCFIVFRIIFKVAKLNLRTSRSSSSPHYFSTHKK